MNEQFKELRLDRVSRHFGHPGGTQIAALHELTLTIRRGEFICLLGPSGCGKTTALNCIAGLLPVTGGTISLDEKRIDLLPPEKRGLMPRKSCAPVLSFDQWPLISPRDSTP